MKVLGSAYYTLKIPIYRYCNGYLFFWNYPRFSIRYTSYRFFFNDCSSLYSHSLPFCNCKQGAWCCFSSLYFGYRKWHTMRDIVNKPIIVIHLNMPVCALLAVYFTCFKLDGERILTDWLLKDEWCLSTLIIKKTLCIKTSHNQPVLFKVVRKLEEFESIWERLWNHATLQQLKHWLRSIPCG